MSIESLPHEICGFEFVSKRELSMGDITAYLYRHKIHGCPFVFLQTKDSHNFFSCTFRTPPSDSSGCSHMLEHLVLEGTEKYPVKGLFNEMEKRSFPTFMNACTSNQWTSFLFSTVNKQDYFNILDVYLDSCFHPKLASLDFMSECFHLEFEDNDERKQLINNGVVYNEMVGMLNSFYHRINNAINENIFDDSVEKFFSAGLPEKIAKSTIDDVRNHHSKYYHPSNAFFYHYGNIQISEVFEKVDDVIKKFPKSDWKFNTSIYNQKRWNVPKRIEIEDTLDPMLKDKSRQYSVVVSYLAGSWKDLDAKNDLNFLRDLLMKGDNSPIYKSIIKSGLAVNYISDRINDADFNLVVNFGFGGVAENDVEKVISTIQETIEKCYIEGFENDRIEALIHENEISSHELTDNMGLKYFLNNVNSVCFGIDPLMNLDCNFYIDKIRENLKDNPKYYQEMIKKTFLDNNHKLTTVVKPVEGFIDRINDQRKNELSEKKNQLNQEQIDQIKRNYDLLKEESAKPQPINLLPSIKKQDIQVIGEYDQVTEIEENVSVLFTPMNGMTSIDLVMKIDFKHPLFDYLPILAHVINKVGAGDMNEDQLDTFVNLHCKMEQIQINGKANLDDCEKGYAQILFSVSCLDRDINDTIKILKMILFDPHLNNIERIKTLVKMLLNRLNQYFRESGNKSLLKIVSSGLTDACAIRNVVNGSYLIQFLNKIIEKDDWNDVCQKLETVYKEIFLRSKTRAFIHTMDENSPSISSMKEIVKRINQTNDQSESCSPVDKSIFQDYKNVFIETESSTNFTEIACKTVSSHDDSSVLYLILKNIMSNEFLYNFVRAEIGAYSVNANQDTNLGIFNISSYRDPNPSKCMEAFWKTIDICASGEKITDEMVDRAIMKVFSNFDLPMAPLYKGWNSFHGETKEMIQKNRDIVFNATKKQIIEIAKLIKEKNWHSGMFSNPSLISPPEGYKTIKINAF